MPFRLSNDPDTGRFIKRLWCDNCQLVSINGMPCHETGCRDSWINPTTGKGYERNCKNCGCAFTPESRECRFCSSCCCHSYYGSTCDCAHCALFNRETE